MKLASAFILLLLALCSTVQNQDLLNIDANLVLQQANFPVDQDPILHIECLENDHFLVGAEVNLYLSKYQKYTDSMAMLNRVEALSGSVDTSMDHVKSCSCISSDILWM